jgi:hypothetical protein
MEGRAPYYSEPPMRLSLSDGLVVHGGMPSTTGLHADTPSAFSHSQVPPSPRAVVPPGANRTPPWGIGPSSLASAPPPALSRTDPPDALRPSDPPPSFRPSRRGAKKVVGGVALLAAVGLTLWGVGVRRPTGATVASVAPVVDRATAPAREQPANPHAVADPRLAPPAAVATVEPIKPASLPAAKEPEPVVTKPARPGKRAPKAAPAAETSTDVAPMPEETAPAPLPPAAAAAQEATNSVTPDIDFNKEAARQALEEAGQRAASCRTIDTPAGSARIAVTFAPAGNVTAAVVESGPFVGTTAGGCVASKFRSVRVPAFTGDPITVHKSISF